MRDKNTYSARSILQSLGIGETRATLAIGQMMMSPRSSDPDAGATMVIVRAVQRGLNQLGCPLLITGRLDKRTEECLARVSGPRWEARPWLNITKDLIYLRDAGLEIPGGETYAEEIGLGAVDFGTKAGMLLAIGGVLYFTLKYKK